MYEQPKLDIPRSALETFLTIFSLLLIFGAFVYILIAWSSLPPTIPNHFDIQGRIDGYGSRTSLFIPPILASAGWFFLTILERYPHIYNYPVKLHDGNREFQYKNARMLVLFLKVEITLLHVHITWTGIRIALQETGKFVTWVPFFFLGLVFLTMAIFIIRSLKKK